jgi:hypothetical protein
MVERQSVASDSSADDSLHQRHERNPETGHQAKGEQNGCRQRLEHQGTDTFVPSLCSSLSMLCRSLEMIPWLRTSPSRPASAMATAMFSAWTSRPRYNTYLLIFVLLYVVCSFGIYYWFARQRLNAAPRTCG